MSGRTISIFISGFCFLAFGGVVSTASGSDFYQELQELKMDNEDLKNRVNQLEEKIEEQKYQADEPAIDGKSHMHRLIQQEIQNQLAVQGRGPFPNVAFRGLVEVEAFVTDQESDIILSTFELGVEAGLSDWTKVWALLLWEEGEGPVDLDEATITLGNREKSPFYLSAGKMYVPFGVYNTFMIQDTLTHELGEVGDTALLVGFAHSKGIGAAVYGFNGDINKEGEEDRINSYGMHLSYDYSEDQASLALAADWISNIGDSEVIADQIVVGIPTGEVAHLVDGLAVYSSAKYKGLQLIGEYVKALDSFEDNELAFQSAGAKPEAWNIELALTAAIMNQEMTFAAGYQGTKQSIVLGLPEHRYLAAVNTAIWDGLSMTLEYLHNEDYSVDDGGSGEDDNRVSLLLAVAF